MASLGVIKTEAGKPNICVDDFICGSFGRQDRLVQISQQGNSNHVNFTTKEIIQLINILKAAEFII